MTGGVHDLAELFGRNGVLRLESKDVRLLPTIAGTELERTGLPRRVEYLFLGERPSRYESGGRTYCRIGSDEGTAVCVDPETGHVLSVPGGTPYPWRFVNSSPALFVDSLCRIARARDELLDVPMTQAIARVEELKRELASLDPGAFGQPDHWWPVVLELFSGIVDQRGEPLRNTAIFEFRVGKDTRRVTCQDGVGLGHAARLAWRAIEILGVKPKDVLRVYSELQPCKLPGGYCEPWLRSMFPNAKVTYSFEYGFTVESRRAGMLALQKEVAKLQS